MQKLSLVLCLLFTNCGHVEIKDAQVCSPIPGNFGAACDDFLISSPVVLSQADWVALQNKWISEGQIVECTNSNAIGDIKAEVEKLCAVEGRCDYETKKSIINGLERILRLGH